jgi:membrane-bound lytic murein transglycosylase
VLAHREGIPPAELTADRLWARLKARPDEARGLMRENRSYIFFAIRSDPSAESRSSPGRHAEEAAGRPSQSTQDRPASFEAPLHGAPQDGGDGSVRPSSRDVVVDSSALDGPIGAAGTPLLAGRSLAVDASVWPYGTLVWLQGELPRPDGGTMPLRRLVVAQDTGTAIVGRARGDLFMGSGPRPGSEAALLRHPVRWIVLRPRPVRP